MTPFQIKTLMKTEEAVLVSSDMTIEDAERANPQIHPTIAKIEECGYEVRFEVDLTQLHAGPTHAILSDVATSRSERGLPPIDQSHVRMDYLRSAEETPQADSALFSSVARSLVNAGVVRATFRYQAPAKQGAARNNLPTLETIATSMAAAGFAATSTTVAKATETVESVVRPNGMTGEITPHQASTTVFDLKKSDPE